MFKHRFFVEVHEFDAKTDSEMSLIWNIHWPWEGFSVVDSHQNTNKRMDIKKKFLISHNTPLKKLKHDKPGQD